MYTITLPEEYTLLSELIQTTEYSKFKIQVISGKILAIESKTKPATYSRAGSAFTVGLYFTSTGADGDLYVRAANPTTIIYVTPSTDGNFSSGISPFTGATGSGSGNNVSIVSAVAEDMFFDNLSARDTWTSGHPERLSQGVTCAVGTTAYNYYMWSVSDASWHDADLIYQGEKGEKGEKGDTGDSGNPVVRQDLSLTGKKFESNIVLKDNTKITAEVDFDYLDVDDVTTIAETEDAKTLDSAKIYTDQEISKVGSGIQSVDNALVSGNQLQTTLTTTSGTKIESDPLALPSAGGSGMPDFSGVADNTLMKVISGTLTSSNIKEINGSIQLSPTSLEIGYHKISSSVDSLVSTNQATGTNSLIQTQDILFHGPDNAYAWRVSGDFFVDTVTVNNGSAALRDIVAFGYFIIEKTSIKFTPNISLASEELIITIDDQIGYKQELNGLVAGEEYTVSLNTPVLISADASVFIRFSTIKPNNLSLGVIPVDKYQLAFMEQPNGSMPLHSGDMSSLIDNLTHTIDYNDFTNLTEHEALIKLRSFALVYRDKDWMVTSDSVPWDCGYDDIISSRIDNSAMGLKHTIHIARQDMPLVSFLRPDSTFVPFHSESSIGIYNADLEQTDYLNTNLVNIAIVSSNFVNCSEVGNSDGLLKISSQDTSIELSSAGLDLKNLPLLNALGIEGTEMLVNDRPTVALNIQGESISTLYNPNDKSWTFIWNESSGGGGGGGDGMMPSGGDYDGKIMEFATSDGMFAKASPLTSTELVNSLNQTQINTKELININASSQKNTVDLIDVKGDISNLKKENTSINSTINALSQGLASQSQGLQAINTKVDSLSIDVMSQGKTTETLENRVDIIEPKLSTVTDMLKVANLIKFTQANIDEEKLRATNNVVEIANMIANGYFKSASNYRFTLDVVVIDDLNGFLPSQGGGALHVRNINRRCYFWFLANSGEHYEASVVGADNVEDAIYRYWTTEANADNVDDLRKEFDEFKSSMTTVVELLTNTVDTTFKNQTLSYLNNILTSTMTDVSGKENQQTVTIQSGGGGGLPPASDPLLVYSGWTDESHMSVIDENFIKNMDIHNTLTKVHEIAKTDLIGSDITSLRESTDGHLPFRHIFVAIPENAIDPMPRTVKTGDAPPAVWNTYLIPFNDTLYRVYMSTSENSLFHAILKFGE